MDVASLLQAGALVLIAFATASATLLAAFLVNRRRDGRRALAQVPEVAYLFEGDTLVDATAAGRRLLGFAPGRGDDMSRLVAFLTPMFPDLHARVCACGEDDRVLLLSTDCQSRLRLETRAGKLRLALEDVQTDRADPPDRHSLAILAAELDAHRTASAAAPVPVWRSRDTGKVVWANASYWALAEQAGLTGELAPGQVPDLFPDLAATTLAGTAKQRVHLTLPTEKEPLWFEAGCTRSGPDKVFSAIPANALITAERNLREFIQTLTQTFAHLSIGLAIFDRKRELTLFNPALGDLLGFEVEFLVARPSLIRFLDQLRERHMMPEPKDYKTWRQKMSELEAAAAEGAHSETWPLPDGRTLRITGRPHPDGAVAFLFEDISAEISLSREYRKELETGHAVIDTLDEAIAVFAADGRLSFANRAYAALWQEECDLGVQNGDTFLEASRVWQKACVPTPVWGDARDFASEMSGRSTWQAEVRLTNGRKIGCRFEPLPGGGTMAGFAPIEHAAFQPLKSDVAEPITTNTARA